MPDFLAEKILYAQGGEYYLGTSATGFMQVDASALTPATGYTPGLIPSICFAGGYFWVIDGVCALRRINATDGTITEPAATAGTIPTGATMLWLYRGRLFHGKFIDDPYNYYASKSGDFLDYDASNITQVGAFAGNDTQQAGLLGDILTAAIPYGDVSCIMGMAGSIAIMRGDPRAGGSIDFLSREVGIAGPTAWCRTPDGDLYFMARDGLYAIQGSAGSSFGAPKPMSLNKLDTTLGQVDFATHTVAMAYDPDEQGVKIFLVPNDGSAGKSVFVSRANGSLWIDEYPAGKSPTAACEVRGAGGTDRKCLLGCQDGYLRILDPAARDDDGALITSYVDYGPLQFHGPMMNAKIVQSRLLFGDNGTNFGATFDLRVGTDPVTARVASPVYSRTLTLAGYQSLNRHRERGACAILRIGNAELSKTWAIEQLTLLVAPSGRVRV